MKFNSLFIRSLCVVLMLLPFGAVSANENFYSSFVAGQSPDEQFVEASENLIASTSGSALASSTGSAGAILSYTAPAFVTVRGVDVKFENAVRAANDITFEIRKNNSVLARQTIFGYGGSLNAESGITGFQYRDIARHNWTKLSLPLSAGEVLTVVITSGVLPNGTSLRATAYEILPTKPLANNLEFMMPSRSEAPISNDNFPTMPTKIAVGNNIHLDPRSHVQNNSNIIRNPYNGKLIAVPAFFSVDEQLSGQNGLKSRLYLYQSKTYGDGNVRDAQGNTIVDWEDKGLLVDIDPNSTDQTQYVGDAHLSYDSEGNVICIFNTVNGIDDVMTRTGLSIKYIKLDKNTGQWSRPFTLHHFEYNETSTWAYCPRMVYDANTRKYILVLNVWNTGDNRHFRVLRLDNLSTTFSLADVRNAPVIIMNNEEGGGMWKVGNEVFISAWKVPSINSPTTRHAIYKAPLAEAHLPGAWKTAAFSGARNEPNNAFQNGGFTADAVNFWVDEAEQKIYRTGVGWGNNRTNNYMVWSQSNYANVWRDDAAVFACLPSEAVARSVIDIPFAANGSYEFTLKPINGGVGLNEYIFFARYANLYVQVSPNYIGIGYYALNGSRVIGSTNAAGIAINVPVTIKIVRANGNTVKLFVNGVERVSGTVDAPDAIASMNEESARWSVEGYSQSEYEISRVTILDADAPATPLPTPTPTATPIPTPNATPIPTPAPGSTSALKINLSPNAPPSGWADEDGFTSGGIALDYSLINNLNVSTAGVVNPAPAEVYKTARYTYGYEPITVTIGGFSPGEVRTVRLHLCEPYLTATTNDRRGNYSINGVLKLANYSIYEAAGGAAKAVVPEFQVAANQAGQFVVLTTIAPSFRGYGALLNGVEVVGNTPAPTPTPTVTPAPTVTPPPGSTSAAKISLSPNAPPSGWADEDGFTSGGIALDYSSINNLNVSTAGVANPAPVEVYKAARYTYGYEPITVTIGGFSPGEVRTVRLHLCEPYLTANINDRRGNYSINGVMKLRNYSIFEAAGGVAKAVVPEFEVAANQAGQFVVSTTIAPSFRGYGALLNGVEVVGNAAPAPTSQGINVALQSNGSSASASSYHSVFHPNGAINGDRKGLNWGGGGGWNDATEGSYADWLQVDFNSARTISEIDIFTVQDNYLSPSEPTPTMAFSNYGITSFNVQYWNGSNWVTVPNGNVGNNNLVWSRFTFSPIVTTKVRVLVNNSLSNYSRITELEAWGW